MKTLLPLLLFLLTAFPSQAQSPDAIAKAAIAFALVAPAAPAPQSDPFAQPRTPSDDERYADAYRNATARNRPLILWIGYKCGSSEVQIPEACHVHIKSFDGSAAPRVIVATHENGQLVRAGTIKPEDVCATAVRTVLAGGRLGAGSMAGGGSFRGG